MNTLPSLFEILKLLVSFYVTFLLRRITNCNIHNFFNIIWARALVAFITWNNFVHHNHCQFFPFSLIMWSLSQIYEIKPSLVSVFTLVFSLLKNRWNFEEYWLVEYDMMGNLMISTWENFQLVKNERVLEVTLARKKKHLQIK